MGFLVWVTLMVWLTNTSLTRRYLHFSIIMLGDFFHPFFSLISTQPSSLTLLPLHLPFYLYSFSLNLVSQPSFSFLSNAKLLFCTAVITPAQNFVWSSSMKKHFVFWVLEQLTGCPIGSQLGSFGRKTGLGPWAGCNGFLSHTTFVRGPWEWSQPVARSGCAGQERSPLVENSACVFPTALLP